MPSHAEAPPRALTHLMTPAPCHTHPRCATAPPRRTASPPHNPSTPPCLLTYPQANPMLPDASRDAHHCPMTPRMTHNTRTHPCPPRPPLDMPHAPATQPACQTCTPTHFDASRPSWTYLPHAPVPQHAPRILHVHQPLPDALQPPLTHTDAYCDPPTCPDPRQMCPTPFRHVLPPADVSHAPLTCPRHVHKLWPVLLYSSGTLMYEGVHLLKNGGIWSGNSRYQE